MAPRALIATTFALIKLGRLHFLAGGVLFHALGVVMALYAGAALDVSALLWGQLAITATQLMTHYANDYFDLEADRANLTPTRWSGGSRVLVEGGVQPRSALYIALGLAAMAVAAALILSTAVRPGPLTLSLLLLAQMAAWCYSAPPLRLHSRGLGELTTMLAVTLLTPLTGYALQSGSIDLVPLLAVVPLCCFQVAMLLAIEFPDAAGDRAVGKRTLVIRLGERAAALLYNGLLGLAYVSLPLLVTGGLPLAVALAVAATSPLALRLAWQMQRGAWREPARWNGLSFQTIVLLMSTAALELLAFAALLVQSVL